MLDWLSSHTVRYDVQSGMSVEICTAPIGLARMRSQIWLGFIVLGKCQLLA